MSIVGIPPFLQLVAGLFGFLVLVATAVALLRSAPSNPHRGLTSDRPDRRSSKAKRPLPSEVDSGSTEAQRAA